MDDVVGMQVVQRGRHVVRPQFSRRKAVASHWDHRPKVTALLHADRNERVSVFETVLESMRESARESDGEVEQVSESQR